MDVIFWLVCTGLVAAGVLCYLVVRNRKRRERVWTPEMVSDPHPAKRQILADCMNSGRMLIGQCDEKGNLFYEKGVSMGKEIVPMAPEDQAILPQMQGAQVGGCILPSGFQIPQAEPGYCWKVVGGRFVLTEKNEQDAE